MSSTPLDAHRNVNANPEVFEPVAATVREAGVEYVYFQTVTLTGRVVGKVVPARHLDRFVVAGVQQHRSAIVNFQADRSGKLIGGGADASELTAIPDLGTLEVLPWDKRVARLFCRLYEPDYHSDVGGLASPTDARGALHRAHEGFNEVTGLELRTGVEPEMTWLGPGLAPNIRPGSSPAYDIQHLEQYREIYQRVISYAQAMGLDMLYGDYEDSNQLELNWAYDRAERTADRLVTYRQICKQVARELGVESSFMPKPALGVMGNGCHHNFSLWRGDANVMLDGAEPTLHLSKLGLNALGGVLTHSRGALLVLACTVNSYKRFWDERQFAPTRLDWGLDNKSCAVRVAAGGRLEYKLPDAMVNPYLSHIVLLGAIRHGMEDQIDPGLPEETSSYEVTHDSPFGALPRTLGEAITAFEDDDYVLNALGRELAELYVEFKSDEWARYCAAVTDWEKALYWDALP